MMNGPGVLTAAQTQADVSANKANPSVRPSNPWQYFFSGGHQGRGNLPPIAGSNQAVGGGAPGLAAPVAGAMRRSNSIATSGGVMKPNASSSGVMQ